MPEQYGKHHPDVPPEMVKVLNETGRKIAEAVKPLGFALLIFDFGEGGFMSYLSNAQRADMLRALKEMVARFEAGEQ